MKGFFLQRSEEDAEIIHSKCLIHIYDLFLKLAHASHQLYLEVQVFEFILLVLSFQKNLEDIFAFDAFSETYA